MSTYAEGHGIPGPPGPPGQPGKPGPQGVKGKLKLTLKSVSSVSVLLSVFHSKYCTVPACMHHLTVMLLLFIISKGTLELLVSLDLQEVGKS